jgi:hypothetical protein
MCRPPPKFLTLIEESVRSSRERVLTCVGLSFPGGGRQVYLGSQRIALAVVSWLVMASGDGGVVLDDAEGRLVGGAVLATKVYL